MKFVGLVLLIVSFSLYGQPDLNQGFSWNGISLPSHLDSISVLKFVKNSNYLQVYVHNQEIKNFEGIEIEQVRYYFYQKKLHSIVIKTKENSEHAEMLLQWLRLMLGEGTQFGFAPRYSWKGKKVEMFYDKNIITHQVEWKIVDVMMQKEYEKVYKKM